MAAITFDVHEWPLVRVRFPEAFTQHEWDAHLDMSHELSARQGNYVFVTDVRGAQAPNAYQRRQAREFYARNDAMLRGRILGAAVIIDSALLRAALGAIYWLQPLPYPFRLCASLEEAE